MELNYLKMFPADYVIIVNQFHSSEVTTELIGIMIHSHSYVLLGIIVQIINTLNGK